MLRRHTTVHITKREIEKAIKSNKLTVLWDHCSGFGIRIAPPGIKNSRSINSFFVRKKRAGRGSPTVNHTWAHRVMATNDSD